MSVNSGASIVFYVHIFRDVWIKKIIHIQHMITAIIVTLLTDRLLSPPDRSRIQHWHSHVSTQ